MQIANIFLPPAMVAATLAIILSCKKTSSEGGSGEIPGV